MIYKNIKIQKSTYIMFMPENEDKQPIRSKFLDNVQIQ